MNNFSRVARENPSCGVRMAKASPSRGGVLAAAREPMSCFPTGPLPPRDPVVLDASGRAVGRAQFTLGIAATDALTKANRTMFAPSQLITLTDDPPRADASLAWKFAHGSIADAQRVDWFSDLAPHGSR